MLNAVQQIKINMMIAKGNAEVIINIPINILVQLAKAKRIVPINAEAIPV